MGPHNWAEEAGPPSPDDDDKQDDKQDDIQDYEQDDKQTIITMV